MRIYSRVSQKPTGHADAQSCSVPPTQNQRVPLSPAGSCLCKTLLASSLSAETPTTYTSGSQRPREHCLYVSILFKRKLPTTATVF